MKQTENLHMKLPELTDLANISDINENMKILDNAIHDVGQKYLTATYLYVNEATGDDNNVGDKEHPLQTLTEAIDRLMLPAKMGQQKVIYLDSDITFTKNIRNITAVQIMGQNHIINTKWIDIDNAHVSFHDTTFHGLNTPQSFHQSCVSFQGCRFMGTAGTTGYNSQIYYYSCKFSLGDSTAVCGERGTFINFYDCEFLKAGIAVMATSGSIVTLNGTTFKSVTSMTNTGVGGKILVSEINDLP